MGSALLHPSQPSLAVDGLPSVYPSLGFPSLVQFPMPFLSSPWQFGYDIPMIPPDLRTYFGSTYAGAPHPHLAASMAQHNDTQLAKMPNWFSGHPMDTRQGLQQRSVPYEPSASVPFNKSSVKIEPGHSNKFADAIDMLTHVAQGDSHLPERDSRPKRHASQIFTGALQDGLLGSSANFNYPSSSPSSASSTASIDSDTESGKSTDYDDAPPSKRRFLESSHLSQFGAPEAHLSFTGTQSMSSNSSGQYISEQHHHRGYLPAGLYSAGTRQTPQYAPKNGSGIMAGSGHASSQLLPPQSSSSVGTSSAAPSAYPYASSASPHPTSAAHSHLTSIQHGKEWCYRHASSDWAKYNWHVRSGGRYIMTEKAHRRYFACDVVGCRAVLYEDSPADEHTGEIIPDGELRMTLQRAHNHAPPESPKPCTDLLSRAAFLLKTLPPLQVREVLIVEAGNGIGIPTMEHIHRCAERGSHPKGKANRDKSAHHAY